MRTLNNVLFNFVKGLCRKLYDVCNYLLLNYFYRIIFNIKRTLNNILHSIHNGNLGLAAPPPRRTLSANLPRHCSLYFVIALCRKLYDCDYDCVCVNKENPSPRQPTITHRHIHHIISCI